MNVLVKHPTLTITKITPTLGAEVTGIDLTKPVDEATRQTLIDALHDNIMLCFRDQKFSPDQFEKAGALFGELILQDQPELFGLEGHPFIRREACIACYCCHELCPETAWKMTGLMGVIRRRRSRQAPKPPKC